MGCVDILAYESALGREKKFTCLVGNSFRKMLLQVISPHQIQITVQELKVSSAIIDEKWDEILQANLPPR
jgi:hypothetical protein